ncbi:TIM barrel protein [Pontiellaceae bacterium B1224]|nr:TIM barrel protein [Pontiellaceae bacterium B1224]
MKSGICSITLRQQQPDEIIALAVQAGLHAIEWGGDVHVPPGDLKTASNVRNMTSDAGLEICSYGSYWKTVEADGNPAPFDPVLESAIALGTDTIRVWAGTKGSDAARADERECVITCLRKALDAAQKQGIRLALEFHAGTLSDSNAATLDLLQELNHPNLYTYWQPIYWINDLQYRLDGLKQLADCVLNLHVFHWLFDPGAGSWGKATDRRPLAEGSNDWKTYFRVPLNPSLDHVALMEFVRNDDPEQVLSDAAVLKQLLSGQN